MADVTEGPLVVVPLDALIQMFGKWGLPPWGPDNLGGDVDCAPLAEQITVDVDTLVAADTKDLLAMNPQTVLYQPGDDPMMLLRAAITELSIADRNHYLAWKADMHRIAIYRDLLELAWGIIANAGQGDWKGTQTEEWVGAAERWRDEYHETLNDPSPGGPEPETEVPE